MWKDEYKKAMDSVAPSEAALKRTRAAMENTKEKKQKDKTKAFISLKKHGLLAAAAAVFLIVAICTPLLSGIITPSGSLLNPVYSINKPSASLSSYKELYDILSKTYSSSTNRYNFYFAYSNQEMGYDGVEMPVVEMPVYGEVPEAEAPSSQITDTNQGVTDNGNGSLTDVDYSDTNNQVEGVQEFDIIKTDGKYIYAVSSKKINIIAVNNGETEIVCSINRVTTGSAYKLSANNMFLKDDKLIIISSCIDETFTDRLFDEVGIARTFYTYSTVVHTYDISDRAKPKQLSVFTQDGVLSTARLIDDKLYLITEKAIYNCDSGDLTSFVPQCYAGTSSELVAPEDIYINESIGMYSYIVLGSFDISNGTKCSSKAVLGYGSTIYCSRDNIYIATNSSNQITVANTDSTGTRFMTTTNIIRFALNSGVLSFEAEASIDGRLLNQFSLDEYDDALRLVTTSNYSYNEETGYYDFGESSNSLFVLDMSLNVIGSITGVAKGEMVYSVRFDGDVGYFVTFRQTDPLFAVDLSDKTNPSILGELKIPGFSQYLQAFGEDKLFGFGMDADETTGTTKGIKLSMFDVSDKDELTELDTFLFGAGSYSEGSYNHKAILVNYKKNLIAFPTNEYTEANMPICKYNIFSYSEADGFKQELSVEVSEPNSYISINVRGLFIGDYFYIITDTNITAYSINDGFAQVSDLAL